MGMNKFKVAAMGLAGLLAASHAQAAVIVNDTFDTYANQAAFQAVWVPIASDATAPSALLSSAQSVSSPNSAHVPGTASNNQYRNRLTHAETGVIGIGDQLIWSFDFYDATGTGNPQRNYANLQDTTAPSGTPQLISMGLNNNLLATDQGGNYYMARLLGGASNGGAASGYFKLNDAGAPLRSAGWHNLKAVLSTDDGLSTDFQFYVDNILSETVLNVGTVIRSYDNITMGSAFSNGSTEAFFDNMRLEYIPAVPEPTSLALLGVAGLFFGRRRRD